MKILIIGAGAIGGSLACYLKKAKADVTVLEKNAEVVEAISNDGMTLRENGEVTSVRVKAVTELNDEDRFDYCFSATRAYHLQSAVKSVLPYLVDGAPVVSMNNGVCIDALKDVVGVERSAWCSINFGAGIEGLGKYYIKISGGVTIGTLGNLSPSLSRLIEVLKAVIPVKVTDNIVGALYSKMLINSCITSTAVISGKTLGEILSTKDGKKVFLGTVREGMKVAKIAGIDVPDYGRGLKYKLFCSKSPLGVIYRAIVFPHLKKKYGTRTSATLEALKRGTKTEIDYFNGYVVSLSKRYGVGAPVNKAIVECVKRVEGDLNQISQSNIKDVASLCK